MQFIQEINTITQDEQGLKDVTFCYWYIKTLPSAITVIVLLVFALILSISILRQFLRSRRINQMSKLVKAIYFSMFFWSLFYSTKMLFALFIYRYPTTLDDSSQNSDRKVQSQWLFIIDINGVFLLQTVLILVPYNWMRMNTMLQNDTIEAETDKKPRPTLQSRAVILLRIYLFIRMPFLSLNFLFIFSQDQSQNGLHNLYLYIMIISLLVEAFFVGVILIVGLYAIKKQNTLSQIVNQNQIQLLKQRYQILIFCALLRIVIDAVFGSNQLKDLKNSCTISPSEASQVLKVFEVIRQVGRILLEAILTHYFPIYQILKMFKVEEVHHTKSLLIPDGSEPSLVDNYLVNQHEQSSSKVQFLATLEQPLIKSDKENNPKR